MGISAGGGTFAFFFFLSALAFPKTKSAVAKLPPETLLMSRMRSAHLHFFPPGTSGKSSCAKPWRTSDVKSAARDPPPLAETKTTGPSPHWSSIALSRSQRCLYQLRDGGALSSAANLSCQIASPSSWPSGSRSVDLEKDRATRISAPTVNERMGQSLHWR